ncbi:MAG: NAD(P)/FAD-dependent oxidoreductase, partial [Gemmatimonadota bacterium]
VANVGIVGAGPAGSRAAELLARQGLEVVVFDPNAPWEKPCGGGLTPPLFEEVPELAEIQSRAYAVEQALIETASGVALRVDLHDRIWIVSRKDLGAWQIERAMEAGAVHRPDRVTSIEESADGWTIEAGGETWTVSYLVGADGAASTVRRAVAPGAPVELVPARLAYPEREAGPEGALVLRFYRDLGGYLWDFPRPDHRSVGIEVTRGPKTRSALDERIDQYGGWKRRPGTEEPARAGAVIGTPAAGRRGFSHIAGRGFALLGDAAGLADPFTGEGIRNAFRSAALLARARRERPDAWSETYRTLARRTFAGEFSMSRRLRRWLSDTGYGVRLVERATDSDIAYGLTAAILEALMRQDYGLASFLSHGFRAWGEIRADPARLRGDASRRSSTATL